MATLREADSPGAALLFPKEGGAVVECDIDANSAAHSAGGTPCTARDMSGGATVG